MNFGLAMLIGKKQKETELNHKRMRKKMYMKIVGLLFTHAYV